MNWTIFSNQLKFPKRFNQLIWLAIYGMLLISIDSKAQTFQLATDSVLHQEVLYRIQYSGAYRDFTIPASANEKYFYLEAQGGDGGCIYFKNHSHIGNGGRGATVTGQFRIGTGVNEIPVGSTLRVVIGGAGGSHTNKGQTFYHSGGGGGGTGVLFLPPGIKVDDANPEDWVILMVAGGGGGGFAKWGGRVVDGYPGSDQEDVTGIYNPNYLYNDSSYETCAPHAARFPGWGGRSGGGVGYQLLQETCDLIPVSNKKPIGDSSASDDDYYSYSGGFGGFRLKDGKMQPIGHKGGSGAMNPNGGFGFGSGGGGSANRPGGGGGYTGGSSGDTNTSSTPAEGGGSFLNIDYINGSIHEIIKNGIVDPSKSGYVQYKIIDSKAP